MLSEKFVLAMTDISSADIDAVGEILGYKKFSAKKHSTKPLRPQQHTAIVAS